MTSDPNAYGISVRRVDEDGEQVFEARVVEFPNLVAYRTSESEAVQLARDLIAASLDLLAEEGSPIPLPQAIDRSAPSGRVTLRVPKHIHAMLIRQAEEDGVSLNSYITTVLTEAVARSVTSSKRSKEITVLLIKESAQRLASVLTGSGTEGRHLHPVYEAWDRVANERFASEIIEATTTGKKHPFEVLDSIRAAKALDPTALSLATSSH